MFFNRQVHEDTITVDETIYYYTNTLFYDINPICDV